jgi:transcriptional regulator with XRE-family HTH domain
VLFCFAIKKVLKQLIRCKNNFSDVLNKLFWIFYYKSGCYLCITAYKTAVNTTNMSLGSQISRIRKERKIAQGELAEKVGIHPNVLGRYEREEATPSVEVAAKIADALSISLDYLVGNTDVLLDKSILDKVVAIQKLPEEDRTHIMYSLDGLIQHAKTRLAYK